VNLLIGVNEPGFQSRVRYNNLWRNWCLLCCDACYVTYDMYSTDQSKTYGGPFRVISRLFPRNILEISQLFLASRKFLRNFSIYFLNYLLLKNFSIFSWLFLASQKFLENFSVDYFSIVSRNNRLYISIMDLFRNDVIIDKMAVLVGGLRHVSIRSNQNELLGTFLRLSKHWPWRNERLGNVMWREIIQPGETRPNFDMDPKLRAFVL